MEYLFILVILTLMLMWLMNSVFDFRIKQLKRDVKFNKGMIERKIELLTHQMEFEERLRSISDIHNKIKNVEKGQAEW